MAEISDRFGLLSGITDREYHADTTTLSASGAKKVLALPARFRYEQDHPQPSSQVFDLGKLAHAVILGEGAAIEVVDAPNWMTKAAKEARDAARADGRIPCLASEWDAVQEMRASVLANETAAELLAGGEAELSGYWRDEPTDAGLRFRPDWLTKMDGRGVFADRTVCVDLKTTVSADPAEFGRSVAKFGYHLQARWYLDGLAAISDDHANACFVFIAVEKNPPYPVSVVELDAEALDEGARLMRRAIDTYARCMDTGIWPGYGDGINTIGLPAWAYRQANDEAAQQLLNELGALT